MRIHKVSLRHLVIVSSLALAMTLWSPMFGSDEKNASDSPTISITSVPNDPPGDTLASEPVKGTVAGGNPKEQKVVVYALGGTTWFVQPTKASPLTDIDDDGKWEAESHGGLKFAALLVKASYEAKPTLDTIPSVGGDVLAKATMKPKPESNKQ